MARIICLANSYKHGGRCIAGINPESGVWVRPIPDTKDRAITEPMMLIDGKEPQVLDVIEIPIEAYGPDEGCQPENRLLKPGKWKKVGRITAQYLLKYCQDDTVILHTHQDYVPPEFFTTHPKTEWRSLQLVHTSNVRFVLNPWQKWRARFHDGTRTQLALKITDPVVLDKLRNGTNISENCIITVSLATPWSPANSDQPKRCYKMVAGVVELRI
jgi:hypothetical protein